jgi:proline iminopeptidase
MPKHRYYPLRPSYKKGYHAVGQGHRIYYELYGNKDGIPVVSLHGGPGTGFKEKHKRIFNPKTFNVLFFDQRGAGKSRPKGQLKYNTTQHLVADIEKLMDHAKIDKALIYGASWGSTLALAFAIAHPERVRALALSGIYLGTKAEHDYLFRGGTKPFAPAAWERFISIVPKGKDPLLHYWNQMKNKSTEHTREMSIYELSLMSIEATDGEKIIDKSVASMLMSESS